MAGDEGEVAGRGQALQGDDDGGGEHGWGKGPAWVHREVHEVHFALPVEDLWRRWF